MEARRDNLTCIKICRFCLAQGDTLTSIYEKRATKNTVNLPLKILSCVSIEVFPSDKMPTYICTRCKFFMEICYDFKHICRQTDEHILQYIQNATPLSSMTWPQSLLKLYRLATAPKQPEVMKTVIEGGTTVHVTAQESESDEEDDENVYNVKIADGSDDGSKSARIKVVTGIDKQDKGKPKRGKASGLDTEESNNSEMVSKNTSTVLESISWDTHISTSPLQQKAEEYVNIPTDEISMNDQQPKVEMQKPKKPHVQCTQCEAKFYSIATMLEHQQSHMQDFYLQCIICDKKITVQRMLTLHEKRVHADIIRQQCPYCPSSFLTLNQLDGHMQKHARIISIRERLFQKVVETCQWQKPPFYCKYCTLRFNSAAKLSRHIQSHAENRSYPCKYCNKSFVKSHHYTRHLRLKHRENIRTCRGPFGESDQYRCEQCEDSFATQDELIYHSAIHATQNLICPLCQEKFEDVDAVTAHIKSHVNGTEFMCDLCELVFTSKEKLDVHISVAHDDEIRSVPDLLQDDQSSTEMDVDDEEDDTGINVKELDDHMVVEIKKANDFLLSNTQEESEDKPDNTHSEESESEMTLPDLATVESITMATKISEKSTPDSVSIATIGGAIITKTVPPKSVEKSDNQTASILRKAEEIKKKVIQQPAQEPITEKKTNNKMENSNTVGASDKSLRLLEKELQELKRTNTRSEVAKTPAKPLETLRSRRAQIHTSTPKPRTPIEEKKPQVVAKSPAPEKKLPERRVVTKENKEPKDSKETKANNVSAKEEKEKESKDKETKEREAKEKERELKEKETPKSAVKNGSEKPAEEGIRRSTRPSKIKDYAKMIRDRSQDSEENDDTDDTDDEEYKETDRSMESKPKPRRASNKTPAPKPAPAPSTPAPRKRGRPRKDAVAPKVRKEEVENEEEDVSDNEKDKSKTAAAEKEQDTSDVSEGNKSTEPKPPTLVSPTGQTLKKIPIRALPPGVKALPLPVNARTMNSGEISEMQIGKKMVKVQKIVMTKAEVEAMAKKGLLEMKDGTMVLKPGIKLPTADTSSLKTNLVREDANKESPKKATPSRCDFGEDA